MSGKEKEFNFGQSRSGNNNQKKNKEEDIEHSTLNDNDNDNGKTENNKILSQYDHFQRLKTSDPKFSKMFKELEFISQNITGYVGTLQNMQKGPEAEKINNLLKELNSQYNILKTKYDNLLEKELSYLYINYKDLYDMVIAGLDRNTLISVLKTLSLVQEGKITKSDAIMGHGVPFMTQKYKLPNNFFNPDALKEYMK